MNKIYQAEFLYYYKNQPNKKEITKPTLSGKEVNLSCGDDMKLDLVIENCVIKDVGYQSQSCAVSEGAMSILAEYLIGKSVKEVKKITETDFVKLINLELTPARQKCALLGFYALKNALGKIV